MARRNIDSRLDFLSPVSLIAGFGPRRAEAFAEAGVTTIGELLYRFPRRYIDRSTITPLANIAQCVDKECCVIGEITRSRVERGRKPRLRIQVTDDTGSVEALWFSGVQYLRASLHTGMRVLLTGKVSLYATVQMVHPLVESLGEKREAPDIAFMPVYPLTEALKEAGVHQKFMLKAIEWALDNLQHYPHLLPASVEQEKGFASLPECLRQMHFPVHPDRLEPFRARLRYEELYQLALSLRWSARAFAQPGRAMVAGATFDAVQASLPFALTDGQRQAVAILHADAAAPARMHRLLQGDVGSGKTVVAFCACLPALNAGLQVAWLAPTEVLARQTSSVVTPWLRSLGLEPALLTGQTSADERRAALTGLANGMVRFAVGTHSLLQPAVRFGKLGMIVIDEQHKFGVAQRLVLQEKDPAADFLLMSATPIPQSLAKTLYGDLDVVTLRGRPAWKSPPRTHLVPPQKRDDMHTFILSRVSQGAARAFYVAPRIEADDEGGTTDVESLYESLARGPFAGTRIALVHGRTPAEERDSTMTQFADGRIRVLVATSIIEVGIDVPDASIIVIADADRFGMASLHQLRGRVGRGGGDAFCFLLSEAEPDTPAYQRLQLLCKEFDGFVLADADLRMRGPGEVAGSMQTGWDDLRLADILRDADLFREIRQTQDRLLPRR